MPGTRSRRVAAVTRPRALRQGCHPGGAARFPRLDCQAARSDSESGRRCQSTNSGNRQGDNRPGAFPGPFLGFGMTAAAIGPPRTRPPRRTGAPMGRGCMPIFTARKATCPTPAIGTDARAARFPRAASRPNGPRSPGNCWREGNMAKPLDELRERLLRAGRMRNPRRSRGSAGPMTSPRR